MPEELEVKLEDRHVENFHSLRISSFEEEEEHQEELLEAEDDEEEEDQEPVTLGFVEKPKNPSLLLRHLFPSKAGGTPAWLDPIDLLSENSRTCDFCKEPLQFLLQIYAPISEKESTFHRTLFVFMCFSMSCVLQDQHEQWKRGPGKPSRSVKVFRCQLSRTNSFYSSEPPRHDGTDKPTRDGAALCCWCGTWKADKICSSCRSVGYCSEKHQAMHWRSGHKIACQRMSITSQTSNSSSSNRKTTSEMTTKFESKTLWPEYEIIHEDECAFDMETAEGNDYSTSLVSRDQLDDTFNSVLTYFEGNDDKRSWASFQERIAKAPQQVLRYCRDAKAKPLWPMSSGCPSKADIPKCRYCNGPLCFEFQILPQLLYYLNVKNEVDSLDWATIVVYTCVASCEASETYREEFAWVQLPSASSLVP